MLELLLVAFGGSGGTPSTPDSPAKPAKQAEVRRVVESAGEARKQERKRVPPGRKSTIFGGITKELENRLGR
jgi:hypothetical protein